MTRMVIVPNVLRDKINAALDAATEGMDVPAEARESLYNDLLSYYDEHGVVPEFRVTTPEEADNHGCEEE